MPGTLTDDVFLHRRQYMVAAQLRRHGIRDERVLATMERVPRHEFIAADSRHRAYDDEPVPIGEGQTVSQPYIVAYMLQQLAIDPQHRVLEVGTGTGYQAALLAEMAREVVTIERHSSLCIAARANLERLGFHNIIVRDGDGSQGWPEAAPYDRIIVAAAAPHLPASLVEQLAEQGRLILPLGSPDFQQLTLVTKRDGLPDSSQLEGCRFVPLIGAAGFTG